MYQGFLGDGWEGSGGKCEGEGGSQGMFSPQTFLKHTQLLFWVKRALLW